MLSADFFSMMTYYSSHTENEVYYYHSVLCGNRAQSHVCLSYAEMQQSVRSKHLGSTAYLTNDSGQVSQVLNYLPYGEDWVEIHNITTFDTTRLGMYRFNGNLIPLVLVCIVSTGKRRTTNPDFTTTAPATTGARC